MPSPLGEGVRGPDRGRMREKCPAAVRYRAGRDRHAPHQPPAGGSFPPLRGEAFRKETYALPHLNRVYGRGKSYVHPHCVLYVAKNRVGYTRIGLTATKKVGHAVQRNRARRVMRAALAEHLSQNIGGYDIILVARGQTPRLKSTQLSKTLGKLFTKAGLPDKAAPAVPAAE